MISKNITQINVRGGTRLRRGRDTWLRKLDKIHTLVAEIEEDRDYYGYCYAIGEELLEQSWLTPFDESQECYWNSQETVRHCFTSVIRGTFLRGLALPSELLDLFPIENEPETAKTISDSKRESVESHLEIRCDIFSYDQPFWIEIDMVHNLPYFRHYQGGKPTEDDENVLSLIISTGPLWLRPLSRWKAPDASLTDVLLDLARYLLMAYYVPWWLHPRHVAGRRYNWLPFLAAARGWRLGEAIHRTAARQGFRLPVSSARKAWDLPQGIDCDCVWNWLLILSHGGTQELCKALQRYSLTSFSELIPSLVSFFKRNPGLIDRAEVVAIWAIHMFTETDSKRSGGNGQFSLNGRSAARVVEAAGAYQVQLSLARASALRSADLAWSPQGWDDEIKMNGCRWTFSEVYTGSALSDETVAMQHCVVTYTARCVVGESSIFSLRCNGERALTVEVHPPTRRVVQVRGIGNRQARPDEAVVVEEWRKRKLESALN